MQALLPEFDVLRQSEFTQESAQETGLTFVENALLKARHASLMSGLPALADDSGLEVDALDGAPGIYSARYAGQPSTDQENITKLLENMANSAERRARFHCTLVCIRHPADPAPLICEGVWEGEVARHPRGENGFGYDPIFLIPELGLTAAEIDLDEKNARSHRGQAMKQLRQRLRS